MPFALFSLCAAAPTSTAGDGPTVWAQPDFIPPATVSALVDLAGTAEWDKCSEKEADGVRECATTAVNSSEIVPTLLEDIGRAMHASVAAVDQITFMRLPPSSPGIPPHHDQYNSSDHGARSTVLLHLTSPKGGRTRFSNLAMTPEAGTLVAFRSTLANGTQIEAAEHHVEAVDADSAAPRLDIMLGMVGELPVFAEPPRKVGPVRRALRAMRRLLFAPKEPVARVGSTICAACLFADPSAISMGCSKVLAIDMRCRDFEVSTGGGASLELLEGKSCLEGKVLPDAGCNGGFAIPMDGNYISEGGACG